MASANIDSVLKAISKQFGDGTAVILSETDDLQVTRTSSGSLNFDMALGGGLPEGRIIEYYGPESGGKTTMALLHAAEMQKKYRDKYVVLVDLEHALDPSLAEEYGIDLKRFIVVQPETAEQGFDVLESFVRSGLVCLGIVDSVAAAIPTAEAEASNSDQQMGLQGRMMGKVLRKITGPAAHANCTIIFINQLREKVGFVMGNPETTPGGRALKFFASIRVSIRPGEKIVGTGGKDDIIGHTINIQVTKNKTAMPGKRASFDLMYGKGIDTVAETVDVAKLAGFIDIAGSWMNFKDDEGNKLSRTVNPEIIAGVTAEEKPLCKVLDENHVELSFQSKDKFVAYLKLDKDLAAVLESAVRSGVAPDRELLLSPRAMYTELLKEEA